MIIMSRKKFEKLVEQIVERKVGAVVSGLVERDKAFSEVVVGLCQRVDKIEDAIKEK